MTLLRVIPTTFCLALLGATFSPSAKADDYNKRTVVTFSGPVEIPPVHITGMRILPAGTYVFKLVNSMSDRHIVQIFNKDESEIYATILAIPNYRLVPKEKTIITFDEGVRARPQPIRAWFYPGANWGEEFVYPKTKAVELAKETNLTVLSLPSEVEVEVAKPEEAKITTELEQTPVVGVRPSGEVVELAQAVQSEPPKTVAAAPPPAPAPAQAESKLPETASSLPLIALCGLLALGGALAFGLMRKRVL